MAQIIDYPTRSIGLGASLGSSLGQGIGGGLAQILQNKVEKVQQNKLAKALMATKNFTPEQARAIAMFQNNPEVAQKMMGLFGTEAPEQQYAQQNQQQPMSQQIQQRQPQIDQTGIANLQKLISPQRENALYKNPMIEGLMQSMGLAHGQKGQPGYMPSFSQDQLSKILGQPTPEEANQPILQEKMPIPEVTNQPFKTARMPLGKRLENRKMELQEQKATKQQELQEKKQAAQEEKEQRVEQHRINKEMMPVYHEITKAEKGAAEDDRRLGKMRTLIEKGDLTRPRWHSALNTIEHGIFGFGVNLHSLETADAQEFDKLSKEFLKNAKNIFGARLTDNDVNTFMKMVPSLSQSREGKLAVIHNMELYNQGIHLRDKAAKQILKENNGKLPYDFEMKVDELVGPQLDKLAAAFAAPQDVKPVEKKKTTYWQDMINGPEMENPLDFIFGKG
jgi:hypothetical protein